MGTSYYLGCHIEMLIDGFSFLGGGEALFVFWGLRYEEEVYRIIKFEATCLL